MQPLQFTLVMNNPRSLRIASPKRVNNATLKTFGEGQNLTESSLMLLVREIFRLSTSLLAIGEL